MDVRRLLAALALGLIWFLFWRLAALETVHANASLWYPPAGLTFALALVLRPREWPLLLTVVLVGTTLSRDWQAVGDAPATHAVLVPLQAAAHALPYLLVAIALRRVLADRCVTDATPALAMLALWPLGAGGAALLGITIVVMAGDVSLQDAPGVFVTWFTGDLLGVATLSSFLAVVLAPPLRHVLGPTAVLVETTPRLWPPKPMALALAPVAALGLVTLARTPDLDQTAGAVTVASYGPTLAMLLIARYTPACQAHAVLAVLVLATMFLAATPGATTDVDPQVLVLALAAAAQIGVSMRALAEESASDPLTGVANRRAWLAGARRRIDRHGPSTVLLVDLDHFKLINDRFGHEVGDDVLRAAAAQLGAAAGVDAWVGRLGGEEFAVLVPGDVRQGEERAHRLREGLRGMAAPPRATGLEVRASIGIAAISVGAELPRALRAADDALYRAKRDGRDRVAHARALVAG